MTKRRPPDEDETPTPQTSGSYALFRDEADRVAELLEQAARLIRKRNDLFAHVAQLDRATEGAKELRALAHRFGSWPALPPTVVAKERGELVPVLFARLRDALELLRSLPSAATEQRARKPR